MNPEKFLLRIFLGWSTYVLTIDKGHEGGGGNGDKDESEVNYWLKR